MRIGKLDNDVLERLILKKFHNVRSETLTHPAIGEDCACIDVGSDLVALSSDPITTANVDSIGALTVHVNCNDAISAGADPVGLLVTLLVPPTSTEQEIGKIADELSHAASVAGVDILGGHTEITDSVTRPVTASTVVARLPREAQAACACSGQQIVMTKSAGLEGGMILASAARRLGVSGVSEAVLAACDAQADNISVVREGRIARESGCRIMHDVTEGGVLGAVWELAYRAKTGVCIDVDAIPVSEAVRKVCGLFDIDPLRLIGSGSLLIVTDDAQALLRKLSEAGIPAAVIGTLTDGGCVDAKGRPIDPPQADEVYKLTHFPS